MGKLLTYIFLCILSCISLAEPFAKTSSYDVCFTPGEDCTQLLVDAINKEEKSLLVQAYSFTSVPIARALVAAKRRGIDVRVILDKSQFSAEKYSASKFLDNQGIPVWIDSKPAIAHNKIFIFGTSSVATGSFNFTKAAQEKNAENLLIIYDAGLTEHYRQNWLKRQNASLKLSDYHPTTVSKQHLHKVNWASHITGPE
jgi:phosphatidylserine/phosphatidylglycerophosphate/cardiolipin synthase-like enzyme